MSIDYVGNPVSLEIPWEKQASGSEPGKRCAYGVRVGLDGDVEATTSRSWKK